MRKKLELVFFTLIIMLMFLTLFRTKTFATVVLNDYNVNTKTSNELLVIRDPKILEKAIKDIYSGESQKNLLTVLNDGTFMKLQNDYNVNAVFAIAVASVESGCGTRCGSTLSAAHNWMIMAGSYNGESVYVNNGIKFKKYPSFSAATLDFGDFIANSKYFFKSNQNTVKEISPSYGGDEWASSVINQMTEIYYVAYSAKYGDINLDKKFDIKDLNELKDYLEGKKELKTVQLKLADVNNDGKVTSFDYLLMISKLRGVIKYFPIEVTYGDLDGDNRITKTDAKMLAEYMNGQRNLSTKQLALADVDGSGKIRAKDVKLILQRAQGLIVAFPVESASNVTLSTEISKKIIQTSRNVLQDMINKNINYGVKTYGDINKTATSDSTYVSCTYVSVVLYKSGLLTEKQINSYNYHYDGKGGISDMLEAAGWTQVKVKDARPGDIINVFGYHTMIYAGDNYIYDETSAQELKTIEPRPLWSAYKNDSRTQVWRAPN